MNRGLLAVLVFLLSWLAFGQAMAVDRSVSTETGNLLLTPEHGGDGSAWGKPNCQSCHVLSLIHEQAPLIRPIVRFKGYGTCAGCHGSNGTAIARRCTVCHNGSDLPDSPIQTGRHAHDFSVAKGRKLDDGNCLSCHVKSDMDGRFELNVDLTPIADARGELSPFASQTDFCLRCHNRDHQPAGVRVRPRESYGQNDPLTAIEDNYTHIDRHGAVDGGNGPYAGLRQPGYRYGRTVECTDCHVMHGTRNAKLILDDSRKGVSRLGGKLRNRSYRAIVRHGNYAPLCVLCHAMDHPEVEEGRVPTANGLSGVHDASSDCTQCHTHGEPVRGGL